MTGPQPPVRSIVPTLVRFLSNSERERTTFRVSPPARVLPGESVTLDLRKLYEPRTYVESVALLTAVVEAVGPAASVHIMGRRVVVAGVLKMLGIALPAMRVTAFGDNPNARGRGR